MMVRVNSKIRALKHLLLGGLFLACFIMPLKSNGQSAQFSGKYLLHVCGSDKNGKELVKGGHIACQAYIAGIMDYHTIMKSMGTAPSVDFCVPPEVGLTDIQKRVMSYVYRRRNQHENFIAAPGVALALYTYYPCKK